MGMFRIHPLVLCKMVYMLTVVLRKADSADEPFVVDSTPPIAGTIYVMYNV